MNPIKPTSRHLLRHNEGNILIEFALILPIMLVLFFGAVEISRFILILQKVDKTAYTMADIITRSKGDPLPGEPLPVGALTVSELQNILDNFDDLMVPYPTTEDGIIVVTSIYMPSGGSTPLVKWQVAGGGNLDYDPPLVSDVNGLSPSQMNPSVRNTPVNFSAEVQAIMDDSGGMRVGENIIVVEVFYHYRPLISTNTLDIGESIVKRNAYFVPRYGNLLNLSPAFTG